MPFSLPSHPGPEDLSLWTIREHRVAWQVPTQLCFIFPDAFEDAGEAGGQFPVSDVRQGQGLAGGGEGSCGCRHRSGGDPAEWPQKDESGSTMPLQALLGISIPDRAGPPLASLQLPGALDTLFLLPGPLLISSYSHLRSFS